MRIDQPVLETFSTTVDLENCQDSEVSQQQLDALMARDVKVVTGMLRIAGANVKFTHLQPSNPLEETDIGIINGFCGSESAYKTFAISTALRGRNVFFIRPPRAQNPIYSLHPIHLRDVLRVQSQASWAVMKEIREQTGRTKYDIYGHSMGTPITTKLAKHKPENVRSVQFAGGAGLVGHMTLVDALRGAMQLGRHDVASGHRNLTNHTPTTEILLDTGHHILRRPDRTAREAMAVARINIRSDVEEVHDAGIKIGAILFGKDGMFKSERVKSATGDLFDFVLEIPDASHIYPQDHPVEHSADVIVTSDELNKSVYLKDTA